MKVKNLLGEERHWKITGYTLGKNERPRSSLHIQARKAIQEVFRSRIILEEVPIRPRTRIQYLDFFLPHQNLVIEVHGEQHYKFVPHFHHTKLGFIKQKKLDNDKKEWCLINNLELKELPYNESIKKWKERLRH